MDRPDYLTQGECARLFPVLSNTSKEGRTTSIVLACLSKIDELGGALLATVGQRVGVRSTVSCFTEVVFANDAGSKERPDGLIVLRTGTKEWKALVEAKVGNAVLSVDQVESYRKIAKENGVDCVITISNQFATSAQHHPLEEIRKSRSKIPIFHWSWMSIFTAADLLLSNDKVEDKDQEILLEELCRFLTHESAGIKGFERMPAEWADLNKLVSAGGSIPAKSAEAIASLEAWHQETRDLSLILSRQTETSVHQKLSRKLIVDPALRVKEELLDLRETHCLAALFDITDAAAPLEVKADLNRRTLEIGMTLRAPEDKKSSKARMNWLLRQIKADDVADVFVQCRWPGRSETTQHSLQDLRNDSGLCEEGKAGLQVVSFRIFSAKRLGARFTQQANFIVDLEKYVPNFYRDIGQNLTAWRRPAPRIREEEVDLDQEPLS